MPSSLNRKFNEPDNKILFYLRRLASIGKPSFFMDKPNSTKPLSPTDAEIATYLEQLFVMHPSLLGAQLGAKLKGRFTNLDIKVRFGGIKTLAETLSDGKIQAVRRHVLDWVFERTSDEQCVGQRIQTESVWRVFHNPQITGKLALNVALASLRVIDRSDQLAEGEVTIERLTHDDQRQIMRDFAVTLDNVTDWKIFIDRPDAEYWRAFMQTVQSKGKQSDWLKFRWQRLCEALSDKLIKAGLPEEAVQPLVRRINEEDVKSRPKLSSSLAFKHEGTTMIDLRRLGHLVIDQMSYDELANIRVSLGAVLAGLNNRR